MRVHCRTNLDDVMQCEKFPTVMDFRPIVGDLIQSSSSWLHNGYPVYLELKVVSTKIVCDPVSGRWYLEVELHLPSRFKSIADFENWYDYIRGKIDQAYYQHRFNQLSTTCG